jgi:ERCC4-type nuclease
MWSQEFRPDETNNEHASGERQTGYLVIKDTREKEQKGWVFQPENLCLGMEVGTVKTGDYTLRGYEDIFTIERKASVSEIANNLSESRWPAFLDRMYSLKYSFIIAECTMQEVLKFPEGSTLPKKIKEKVRMTGKIILKKLCEQMYSHELNIIWAGNSINAQEVAKSLFKRIYEKYPDKAR